jgi:(1->4)-alpha-D-glucan 1-alpha-D-glucosylmutase
MRIPAATYRLQFTPEFGFGQALRALPYLRDLGISDIYASPIFHARAGSLHGYDVVDPNRLNPELGSLEDFERLVGEARRLGLGWVQDIVPNHMAYDSRNQMLMDVLENGPASRYADFFDIQWNHPYESMKGKVLAPFLGRFYGECLEDGDIILRYDQNGLSVRYFSLTLPVNIEAYSDVLSDDLAALRTRLGASDLDFIKLLGILYTLKNIAPERIERTDQIVFVKRVLWELYNSSGEIKQHVDCSLAKFNGAKGRPETFNSLDRLLAQQWYRLSFWKVAAEELDYRRFFNINELISLRMEDEKVYRHTHALILKLVGEGKFTGLRVDHVDGLYDPLGYLRWLRRDCRDAYLTVEKILGFQEELPAVWPVQGTSGYEFLNHVNGIFCDRRQRGPFSQIYKRFSGIETTCAALTVEKKRLIIGKYMAGDIEALAFLLKNVSSRDRHAVDVTLYGLKRALVEVLAYFPVYRSYINGDQCGADDRRWLGIAVERAKTANAGLLFELQFIERFLMLDFTEHLSEEEKRDRIHFVMRFQQLTGPLMAKGFEDTTLYVYNRLLSLNDVGGDPDRFGVSIGEFHEFNRRRRALSPHTMSATATHDSKRGEDMRARLNALSELPQEWEAQLKSWSKINRPKKRRIRGSEVPDRNDEYFLYQTLIGSYPAGAPHDGMYLERLKAYLVKAVREAKVHTEWLKPDLAYEEAFVDFAGTILSMSAENRFLEEFRPFVHRVAHRGMLNSLGQTLIKIVAPGIPDIYQGTEYWDLSFVDPDNRRPVDFAGRQRALDQIKLAQSNDRLGSMHDLLAGWPDGRVKLFLLSQLLNFRRDHASLFAEGDYIPLRGDGAVDRQICAFARRRDRSWVVAIVPRLTAAMSGCAGMPLGNAAWGSSSLTLPGGAPRAWHNAITGAPVGASSGKVLRLAEALEHFPVSLLHGQEPNDGAPVIRERKDATAVQHSV